MFSVDNFYEFFNSCYGLKSKNIVPWSFRPHGSKNLAESFPLIEKYPHASMELAELQISNALIMHDQESFFHDHCMHIYRTDLLGNKKNPAWQEMTNEELFLQKWRTCSWPIFCHSEKNSKDIAWVEQTGCIPCYYFWHGLIARDWFRHWKHYNNLQNQSTWQKRFLLYIRDCSGTRSYRSDIKNRLYELKDQIDIMIEIIIGRNFNFIRFFEFYFVKNILILQIFRIIKLMWIERILKDFRCFKKLDFISNFYNFFSLFRNIKNDFSTTILLIYRSRFQYKLIVISSRFQFF